MNLNHSENLEIIPNLMEATNLETLNLSWCESLVELPSSIKNLHRLTLLEMSCCKRLEIIPTNINLASLKHLHFRYCSRLKTFPEISTNITYLKIRGTAITEVPPSVRNWHNILEICMERTKVKVLDYVPYGLDALCLRGNTALRSLPYNLILFRLLRMIDISFCTNITSLPKLPDSVSALTAVNCNSLQSLHAHFNLSSKLNFTNCLKLDEEAKENIINRSIYRVTWIPGDKVPAYFPHRFKSYYIMIKSDLTKFVAFKACLVFGAGKPFKGCDTRFYNNPDNQRKYSTRPKLWEPTLEMDHLYMFEYALPPRKNDGPLQVEVHRTRKSSLFTFNCYGCEIKECGIQLLEPRVRYIPQSLPTNHYSSISSSSISIEEITDADNGEGTSGRKSVMSWIKVRARKLGLSFEFLNKRKKLGINHRR